MNYRAWWLVIGGLSLLVACSDDGTGGSGATAGSNAGGNGGTGAAPAGGGVLDGGSATGGAASGGGPEGGAANGGAGQGGAALNSGDCDTADDCAEGTSCVEIVPGGFRACTDIVTEATACSQPELDECCTSAECQTGTCVLTPLTPYCGGVQPLDYNVCAVDQCDSEADCQGGDSACLPAPMLGYKVRACFATQCHTDTDCGAEAGGICAPVAEACCGGIVGLYCVYPSDGCRSDADCAEGYCAIEGDRAHCEAGVPICPA